MADGFVQLAADGVGKKTQTFENTVGAEVVHSQAVSLVSTDGAPVAPLTDTQLRAEAVPVSGAFFQATQPVSIASMPSTPVTGTFWQVTQPVSIASMPSTPVTGTFWQATQPVSIATAAMTWVSLKSAAPTASAVQADTGALTAGDYDFDINLSASDTVAVGKGLVIEHRNAANSATLFNLGAVPAAGSNTFQLRRYTIATNERIRVIAGTAAGAASSMYVSAIGRRAS